MAIIEVRDGKTWVVEPEGEWELGQEAEQGIGWGAEQTVTETSTVEDKLVCLETQTLILAGAIADIYEEVLGKVPAELKELMVEKKTSEHPIKGAE